jgi:hypothetical protein
MSSYIANALGRILIWPPTTGIWTTGKWVEIKLKLQEIKSRELKNMKTFWGTGGPPDTDFTRLIIEPRHFFALRAFITVQPGFMPT